MFKFIEDLNENAKIALGLIIAERMFSMIDRTEDGYKVGRDALDCCWKWLEGEAMDANDIYYHIDSDDGDDVAELAYDEDNVEKQYVWHTVLDAVSYTIYQAYKRENRKTAPQAIEIINDKTLIISGENAIESKIFKIESLNKLKKYLLENYSAYTASEERPIIKEKLIKIVNDN